MMEDHSLHVALRRLTSEIDASVAKERDYAARIKDISTKSDAFYAAYTSAQENVARKEEEINALRAELRELKGLEKRVICLLDGDGTIFSPDLIAQGQQGGLEAARLLTERVRQELASDLGHEQFHLWTYLFYNRRGLFETFGRVGLSAAQSKFDDFIIGFNQAAERFLMVDVGGSKEAADAKIKVHLQDNIRLPQTHKIIFGGSHDNGYVNVLRSVMTEGFRDKLILLPGYSDVALDIKALSLPEIRVANLFISAKLPPSYMSIASGPPPGLSATPRLPPPSPHMSNLITPAHPLKDASNSIPRQNNSVQGYKSALQTGHIDTVPYESSDSNSSIDASDANPARLIQFRPMIPSGKQRRVNPNIPLSKHVPPPCTLHYLANCRLGSDCRYSHDYILDAEHYEELRVNAKKTPCRVANEGGICTYGDICVYGHVCPNGTTCIYLKLGHCKFQAAGMHRGG